MARDGRMRDYLDAVGTQIRWRRARRPLLRELESDPKYAFLWDAVEFRALIARYRARCAAAEEPA